MKSAQHGKGISKVEVANVSSNGFWLLIKDEEHFVPFELFPWFRDASIGQLVNVQLPSKHHLYWPELDVDLSVESISHPERFPLVSSPVGKKSTRPKRDTARAKRSPRKAGIK